jgi:peptidoglycan/LPS O-acetylase OafA/YrhL
MSPSLVAKNESTFERIQFLDGLRGVAILMVILFHAYIRWPNLYRYGDKFVHYGFLNTKTSGVNLFFIISGFVILMTLRKCKNFFEFLIHRWLRLFPAMLICSLLIWISSGLFPERPAGSVHIFDLLPGVTFLGEGPMEYFSPLTHTVPHLIEGAFWSLFVEVKFYIVFGAIFYYLGESISIAALFCLFGIGAINSLSTYMSAHYSGANWSAAFENIHSFLVATNVSRLSEELYLQLYGFFGAGALLFLYYSSKKQRYWILALLFGILSTPFSSSRSANILVVILICSAVRFNALRSILDNKILLFVGCISYPLYLIHENIVVAMIVKFGRTLPWMPDCLIPLLPICVVLLCSWPIAKILEPTTKNFLKYLLKRVHVLS